MATATRLVVIESVSCGVCGVIFGLEAQYRASRLEDGKTFFCPQGHVVGYSDSENKRLRDSLQRAQQSAIWAREQADRAENAREAAERSANAYKGVATRVKRRGAAGICTLGCNRHFADVERHNRTKHQAETEAVLRG